MPQYSVDITPDDKTLGKFVDDELKKHFMNSSIIIRGIASSEHQNKSVDELVRIISETGTDRYDPERTGDRYENVDHKQIDLFAISEKITPTSNVFHKLIWGFYHGAKEIHGYPVRIDIIMIYDASQMQQVTHRYEGREDVKDDGFVFKNPAEKVRALKGVIRIDKEF